MAQLKWHDSPQQTPAQARKSSSEKNPWFGLSMGLLGLIAGFVIASVIIGNV